VYEQSIVMEIPHHTIPTPIFLLLETFPLLVPWLHQERPWLPQVFAKDASAPLSSAKLGLTARIRYECAIEGMRR
jgi:hypothetical protein